MKKVRMIILVTFIPAVIAGCSNGFSSRNSPSNPASGGELVEWQQVERLARPAINEGLILTNDYLNAFNSITPDLDLSAAASDVVNEALTVLTVVKQAGVNLGARDESADEFEPLEIGLAFLPDVMRIDVDNSNAIPNSTTGSPVSVAEVGYLSCVNSTYLDGVVNNETGPLLCGGRKIRDDVIDITLTFLVTGQDNGGDLVALGLIDNAGNTAYAVSDRIKYGDQGQDPLLNGFPYLAKPH